MKITQENCFSFLLACFPSFASAWKRYLNYWGENQRTFTLDFLEFSDYVINLIRTGKKQELPAIFQVVECFFLIGDQKIQHAIATSFLEPIAQSIPGLFSEKDVVPYLGEKSSTFFNFKHIASKSLLNDKAVFDILHYQRKIELWSAIKKWLIIHSSSSLTDQPSAEKIVKLLEQSLGKGVEEKITEANCIFFILQNFPDYFTVLDEYLDDWYEERDLTSDFSNFACYAINLIKQKNTKDVLAIFSVMEIMLVTSENTVRDAIATGFFERLLNVVPEQLSEATFVPYLGKESKKYCKSYDVLTGVMSGGLWDDDKIEIEKKLASRKVCGQYLHSIHEAILQCAYLRKWLNDNYSKAPAKETEETKIAIMDLLGILGIAG